MKAILLFFSVLLATSYSYGQLGFCNGSKGDPIFFENFGSGTNFGPQLPAGTTSYSYVNGTPNDGSYTLYYKTNANPNWHDAPDHTPDNEVDGASGKSLIVNASFTAGEFYKRTVNNLCVNTDFEFTAWVMNVCKASDCNGNPIPNDVTFEIWNASETVLLKSGSTGSINSTNSPVWTQFGLTFTTPPGDTSVVLKMKNNGIGGCGNDLAIDDIMFRSCGDITRLTSPGISGSQFTICEDNTPVSLTMNVDISTATPHAFQWQYSQDTSNWFDIPGETAMSYTTPNVISPHYYRVKVAQDAANLANAFCYTLSEFFSIIIIPKPNQPTVNGNDNFVICGNDPIPTFSVTPGSGDSVDWFDAPSGGNLLLANSITYTPTGAGNYFAESYRQTDCRSAARTEFNLVINPAPVIPISSNDPLVICENKTLDLSVNITGVTYEWSTNPIQTTQVITIDAPGTYTVTVTNGVGCDDSQTFTVVENLIPVISDILLEGNTVTINMATIGSYEYSLDGFSYQTSNVFNNVRGGLKTAYVRETKNCGEDQEDFLLILVPPYFTPNGDGFNDVFTIPGLELIPNARISIFDRFGKLITVISSENPDWDGMLNGVQLPSTDYWYRAVFQDGKEFKGHFSLKR